MNQNSSQVMLYGENSNRGRIPMIPRATVSANEESKTTSDIERKN